MRSLMWSNPKVTVGLAATLSLLFAASASATTGIAQAGADAASSEAAAQSVNARSVTFKAMPTVSIEEIVVTAEQSFSSLRNQIDSAEVALYGVYNDLNGSDEFDIDCRESDWAGTHIREQMCWPQFLTELSARNAQDWRFGIDVLIPVDHMVLLYGDRMAALRADIRRVAGEHPEAADALLEVGKLQAALKRKREACMAQKPVLFVFRLCKS